MIELAPRFILDRHRHGRHRGRFNGTSVFVDLVGFTSMTESLMVNGTPGAEQVSAAINTVFEPAIHATYSHGGWIAKYAGDAFLALFPAGSSPRARLAARDITESLAQGHAVSTPYGSFPVAARVGVGGGAVSWGIIPASGRNVFFFAGSAVRRAIDAQATAAPGSWAVQFPPRWPLDDVHESPRTPIAGEIGPPPHARWSASATPAQLSGLASFVPREIIELGTRGEFREIACVFLGFQGRTRPIDRPNHEVLAHVMAVVGAEVERYGGYLSELDFGDKGSVVVIYFGAPRGLERPMQHALGFATSVRDALGELAAVRIGVTLGRVYAGLVGSPLRAEYKAVGRTVNLAARLMASAAWGSIVLDEASATGVGEGFALQRCGQASLKGIPAPVQVCAVTGTSRGRRGRLEGGLVGREDDAARVCAHLAAVEVAGQARVVYIDGPPGIGKSRLVGAVRDACAGRDAWCSLACDGILRESLNPFARWAADYFGCGVERSVEENRLSFDATFDRLVATSEGETRRELLRTRSVAGALVGLRWENSLYEQLDAKGRFANTAVALTHLFKVEASRGPVVIELEDCHWIDTSSAELLRRIMRGLKECPVLLLATCRLNDDGSPFRLPLETLPSTSIMLDALNRQACLALAHGRLGARVSRPLAEFLWAKSEGNPFYLEQLLLLLKACGALRIVRSVVTLAFEPQDLPGTLSALIVARVDRLPPELKRVAKVASVIGREFSAVVLGAMLRSLRIAPLLASGQRQELWKGSAEGQYAFTHALIQDALYEIQLTAERARLHLQAGEAIETTYAGHLTSHYGALAHHFDMGGDVGRARVYLEKAAEAAERAFSNDDALRFLGRLGDYATAEAEAAEISLRRGRVLDRVGRLDDAASVLEQASTVAHGVGDLTLLVRVRNAWADVLIQQGQKDGARELFTQNLRSCRERGDDAWCSISLSNLGRIHRMEGDLDRAADRFREAIRLATRAKDRRRVAYALGNLGNLCYVRGDMRKSTQCYRRCLEVSQELDDLYSVCRCEAGLGLVHFQAGRYDLAARHFRGQLAVAERIGDQSVVAGAAENVGLLYERAGEWEKALESFTRRVQLAEEMGSRVSLGTAQAMVARVYFAAGRYEQGITLSDRAIEIARELGMRDFLIHFLTDRASALVRRAERFPSAPLDEIESLCGEAIELAQRLGMPNALFLPMLARLRLDALRGESEKAIAGLVRLAEQYTDDNDQALLRAAIARITRRPPDIREAFNRYRALYRDDPDHSYLAAMRELAAMDEAEGAALLAQVTPVQWISILDAPP